MANTQTTEETTPKTEEASTTQAEFTPITTQEVFDQLFNKRWAREQAKYADFEIYKAAYEKLHQMEEADKSELQKAEERASKAEDKLAELEQQSKLANLKQVIAAEQGLDPRVLYGSTKEELLECAANIKAVIGSRAAPVVHADGQAADELDTSDLRKVAKQLFG